MERTHMKTRTLKRVMIEHSIFRQMLSYKPYVSFQADKQRLKNELKQDIINFYSDKFYRLKEGSRAAIDFILFSGCSLGFSYASQEYLAQFGVSERTIRRIMSELQDAGLISIAYRRNGRFNMCKKPVYFMTKHPYFDYWKSLIGIDDQSSIRVDDQEQNDRIVDTLIDSEENLLSNNKLTSSQSSNCIKDRGKDIDTVPDNIDHDFSKLYSCYFGLDVKAINNLWHICTHQAWTQNIDPEHIAEGAIHALKQTVGQMKIKKIKNVAAYFTATLKAIYHDIFIDECFEKFGVDITQPFEFTMPCN